jgi:nitrogen PTS system EIIA component
MVMICIVWLLGSPKLSSSAVQWNVRAPHPARSLWQKPHFPTAVQEKNGSSTPPKIGGPTNAPIRRAWYLLAMFRDRLEVREAALLLNVSERTVQRWIRQGLFNASSSSRGIERAELLRWASDHGITVSQRRRGEPKPAADLLADAVGRGAVITECSPESAAEAISTAIAEVPGLAAPQREELLDAVLQRERMAGTGMGHGVALPHPRKPPAHIFDVPVISICFPERPLDWAALDGQPVHTVFLLLSPSAPVHLQILSRVAFALRSQGFRDFLRGRPNREAFVEHLLAIRKDD